MTLMPLFGMKTAYSAVIPQTRGAGLDKAYPLSVKASHDLQGIF